MLSDVLQQWGFSPETPLEMYADVFRLGSNLIQKEGEPPGSYKANPLIFGYDGKRMHRQIMFEDTFQEKLEECCEYEWTYMSGCTYFGRSNTAEHQSKLYALIFDLDGVDDSTLLNFFSGALADFYPLPQHIVLSGHGVHFYYIFEEPLELYPNTKTQLKELKYALTRRIWNRYTSNEETIQYQGINQAFRVPGSRTKKDAPFPRALAYKGLTDLTTIEELNKYVPEESRVNLNLCFKESKYTLEEAKSKFPEWYERIIIQGKHGNQWTVKEDLYNWWLRRIEKEATFGHRYYCIMALAIFAAKCNIYDVGRVRKDAIALIPTFNALNPDKPFTEENINDALECLDSRFVTFPRSDIEKKTEILMPENKRNGRKQAVHLAGARAIQKVNDDFNGTNWRNGNGRKPKRDLVRNFAAAHPGLSNRQIATELGVSRNTVNKWLK